MYSSAKVSVGLLCASLAPSFPSSAPVQRESVPFRNYIRNQQTEDYTFNISEAQDLEQSYKSHPSVLEDPFYIDRFSRGLRVLENLAGIWWTYYQFPPEIPFSSASHLETHQRVDIYPLDRRRRSLSSR